jgi:hypothetical protein
MAGRGGVVREGLRAALGGRAVAADAEEYGVSIGTARRALVVLREAGLIVVTPSWGAFIPQ